VGTVQKCGDDVKMQVYDRILRGENTTMKKYKYIMKLVNKQRVNADVLEYLMDEHGSKFSPNMEDKILQTFRLKVPAEDED